MNRWHRYLFSPVAALRPGLFARVFLLLLTADIWRTFIVNGPRRGAGGFDVAHFDWLDRIQPLPTPELYIAIMIVASFALALAALSGLHRGLLAVAFILFTYGWAMSQSDSYQHHYLLSLILLCVVFFPNVNATDIAHAAGRDFGINAAPRMISAWAYVMLGTQIAIVYAWTMIAKLDESWMRGDVVSRFMNTLMKNDDVPAVPALTSILSNEVVWKALAIGAIVIEACLACGYVYALGQDRRAGTRPRRIMLALWMTATVFHIGTLLLPLSIGLFAYYMLLCGLIFLLPAKWLGRIARFSVEPVRLCAVKLVWVINPAGSPIVCLAEAAFIAAALVGLGYALDLPGTRAGMWIAAATAVALIAIDLWRRRTPAAQQNVLASAAFAAFIGALTLNGSLQYRVNMHLAQMQHFAGDPKEAFRYYAKAASFAPNESKASLYNNIGDVLRELKAVPEAVEWFEAALQIDPDDPAAHANMGAALMTLHREDEAIEHYRKAVNANLRSSIAHYNFAFALQSKNRMDEAMEQYRLAIELDPDMLAAHNNLAALQLMNGRLDEARTHLREVLRLDSQDVSAMNNLAWMLATDANPTAAQVQEAVTLARRAAELTGHRSAVVLGTLAEAYAAAAMPHDAIRTAEQAVKLAQSLGQESVAAQITVRLERYRHEASP